MKKIIYVTLATLFLASCTGVAPFSKAKYGHLKWIKKGAVIDEHSSVVIPAQEKTDVKSGNGLVVQPEEAMDQPAQVAPVQPVSENTHPVDNANTGLTRKPAATPSVNSVNEVETPVTTPSTDTYEKQGTVKPAKKPSKPFMDETVRLILALVLCFVLPPFGVYLYRETGSPFLITLILCLISLLGFWFFWY